MRSWDSSFRQRRKYQRAEKGVRRPRMSGSPDIRDHPRGGWIRRGWIFGHPDFQSRSPKWHLLKGFGVSALWKCPLQGDSAEDLVRNLLVCHFGRAKFDTGRPKFWYFLWWVNAKQGRVQRGYGTNSWWLQCWGNTYSTWRSSWFSNVRNQKSAPLLLDRLRDLAECTSKTEKGTVGVSARALHAATSSTAWLRKSRRKLKRKLKRKTQAKKVGEKRRRKR